MTYDTTHAFNEGHWIRCTCGNEPDKAGFYPVDGQGRDIDVAESGPELYQCDSCGTVWALPSSDYVGPLSRVHMHQAGR